MQKYLLLLLPLCIPLQFTAQIFTSNGAAISILNGAIVQVNGGMTLNAGPLDNAGTLTISANSTLPLAGTISILSAASVSGDGTYRIEQDWINNAVFNADQSTVQLFGNTQQFITSSNGTSTLFHNLALSGTGTGANRKKTLQNISASSNGVLSLNDRELETQTNDFNVLNSDLAAVTNSLVAGGEGFVSSVQPGLLTRVIELAGIYSFPTGSSSGTMRYRPVEIVSSSLQPGAYGARLNNFDATAGGFDRDDNDGTFCTENPIFFHSVERLAGTLPVDIRLFYIPASDGSWSSMGHWRTTNLLWNNMGTTAGGTVSGFSTQTRNAWAFANPGDEYILTNVRPEPPQIECPLICENSVDNEFSATGSTGVYQWQVPANGTLTAGQGTGSITADWTQGTNYVYVVGTGANGCNSLPDSCQPSVYAMPQADFDYQIGSDGVQFDDQSANASEWEWSLGDGYLSNDQNPFHTYGGGTYAVLLTASNPAGCNDTITKFITLDETIIVPNVFSPDGDGVNDLFAIQTGVLKEFRLDIVNRWGETMFTSDDPADQWDGTSNGNPCTDGVYFYVLKIATATNDYEFQGMVTLVK